MKTIFLILLTMAQPSDAAATVPDPDPAPGEDGSRGRRGIADPLVPQHCNRRQRCLHLDR